ncbi:hypothetical protein BPC006_II2932 [Burkholderia pseudomallei BPC006]|nr:hypothetical protein BPC006_II2932 [Burkholderia pseudomallei BPC006]
MGYAWAVRRASAERARRARAPARCICREAASPGM